MPHTELLFKSLSAERIRRRADDLIHESQITRCRFARERLKDAAARTLEAARFEEDAVSLRVRSGEWSDV